MILECIKYIINFTMGVENIERKGTKSVESSHSSMMDAAVAPFEEAGKLLSGLFDMSWWGKIFPF